MSVYVKYDPWGRMGNRMFQYVFGYILANKKQTNLYTEGLPNFNILDNYQHFKTDSIHTSHYGNQYVNWEELIFSSKDIVVDSFLQKSSYYIEHQTNLREIFKVDKDKKIKNDSLVLHIRETDYKDINCFLGYDFYKFLIKEINANNIIIVTDNSNCETVKKLVADGCLLYTEGYVDKFQHTSDDRGMKDFNFMLYSSNLAISQSSFSWWAAFLGNHDKIYFPYTKNSGMWKLTPEQDDINLYFDFGKSYRVIL
jgi:hypothetical protein